MGILQSIQNIFIRENKKPEKREIRYNFGFGNKTAVSPATALTFSAVWAAIRLISESVASMPLAVYKKEKNGDKIEIENELSFLLKYKPNSYQNKIVFFEKILVDLLCNGNSFVQIVRNGAGRPIELLPLDYAGVDVFFKDNQIYYTSTELDGSYSSDEILHFKLITDVNASKNNNTKNGILGLSPIEQNANAISWGQSVEEYGSTFFANGAKLSGILKTSRSLSEQAIDRLRSSFNNNYAKLSGSNQTAVLEEGLEYQPISISAEQAQFLKSREFSVAEVARIFNCPPHLLKDLTRSTNNNIEMQSQEFVSYTLLPFLTKLELEMNTKLFSRASIGKEYIKFNANGLLRTNVKDRADYYKTAITNGWLTINEVRALEDLNNVTEGDKNYIALNLTTIDSCNNCTKKEDDASGTM